MTLKGTLMVVIQVKMSVSIPEEASPEKREPINLEEDDSPRNQWRQNNAEHDVTSRDRRKESVTFGTDGRKCSEERKKSEQKQVKKRQSVRLVVESRASSEIK